MTAKSAKSASLASLRKQHMCCFIGGDIHLLSPYLSQLILPPYPLTSLLHHLHLLRRQMPFHRPPRHTRSPTVRPHRQQTEKRSPYQCHLLRQSSMHQFGRRTSKPLTDAVPQPTYVCAIQELLQSANCDGLIDSAVNITIYTYNW